VQSGDSRERDPVEHALEAKQFEVKRHGAARAFGQACLMNPTQIFRRINATARKNSRR
jgi:hypothetical protein